MAISTVVHVRPNSQDLCDPAPFPVSSFREKIRELLELRKVALLFRGEKPVVIEKRNHIVRDRREVIHFVVPDSISSLSHRPTAQVPLKLRENHRVSLGDVEAEGDLPRDLIVAPGTEGDVEASFSIRKSRQVVTDFNRYGLGVEHRSSLSC